MKEKIKNLMNSIKSNQKRNRMFFIASTLIVVAIAALVLSPISRSDALSVTNNESADSKSSDVDGPTILVVGEEDSSIIGNTSSNNSWPGELISLSNLQVQPDREGTLAQWYVRMGERVRAGQVIGKLSRPPQTPEMVSMLSEKYEELSMERTKLAALRSYTEKRVAQLQKLRVDTEKSNKMKLDLLGSSASMSDEVSLSSIASKKKLAQVIVRGSITKTLPMISSQTNIPPLGLVSSLQLKSVIGILDANVRSNFTSILLKVLSDLKDPNIMPEQSGSAYFDSAIRLANASITDPEMLGETDLASLRQMLVEDQLEFLMVLGEIKSMDLERVNTQRESIDTLAEIDAMIAELEKELAMSEGELAAKEVAYLSIKGSITGGYSIVAPNSGVVSSIMKKPGEFVGPGMPVATVTAESSDKTLIRMRIPNNVKKSKIGESLSIVRPGFEIDVKKARLVGVGSSLDSDGSYMADAVFLEPTTWPIGASVRVLAPSTAQAVFVKHSSLVWNENDTPAIWAVSDADRVFKKKIGIGRTLGSLIEVYEGLKHGDRYIGNPTESLHENTLLEDTEQTVTSHGSTEKSPTKQNEHESMPGM